jgi:serine/threonine protein phosphatase PrpC
MEAARGVLDARKQEFQSETLPVSNPGHNGSSNTSNNAAVQAQIPSLPDPGLHVTPALPNSPAGKSSGDNQGSQSGQTIIRGQASPATQPNMAANGVKVPSNSANSSQGGAAAVKSSIPEAASPTPMKDVDVMEHTRSLWRDIPPIDPTDPVDPTSRVIKSGSFGEVMVGASLRGRSHAHDGKYREDAFSVAVAGNWSLIAVADGTGSKPLARVGSRLAANAAVEYMKSRLIQLKTADQAPATLRGTLAGAMVNSLGAIADEAASRQREANDFATTLLLVVYGICEGRRWLGLAQVGDGGIAIQRQNGECIQMGRSDHGQSGGESVFLTSHEAQLTWNQRVFVYEVQDVFQRLIVATDGVYDDFSPPFGKTERLFEELLVLADQRDPSGWLLEWLSYERRGSFDDRTLVVLSPGKN